MLAPGEYLTKFNHLVNMHLISRDPQDFVKFPVLCFMFPANYQLCCESLSGFWPSDVPDNGPLVHCPHSFLSLAMRSVPCP